MSSYSLQGNLVYRLILIGSLLFLSGCRDKGSGNEAGKALYTEKGCNACHGDDARTPVMAAYPKLAGQTKEYLVIQTRDIRDDVRTNGQSGIMKATILDLTDEEIEQIAAWLSSLE